MILRRWLGVRPVPELAALAGDPVDAAPPSSGSWRKLGGSDWNCDLLHGIRKVVAT